MMIAKQYVIPFFIPKQASAPTHDSELTIELDKKLHALAWLHDLLAMMISSVVLEHAYKNAVEY